MDNSLNSQDSTQIPFEEAILKAKIAQICDHVGYNAITQDSSNILVDLYRRTVHHLARHCKEAANNNRRIEPTITDLVQAYDFVGISINELSEHIDTVKIPLNVEIRQEEPEKPPNRIQRTLLVDDLLEAEKTNHDDNDGENSHENEDKPTIPLLKDTFQELSSKFAQSSPVKADKKIRPGRIVLLANKLKIATPLLAAEPLASTSGSNTKPTKSSAKGPSPKVKPLKKKRGARGGAGPSKKKLKTAITPLDPSIAEPPSFFPLLEGKLDDPDIELPTNIHSHVPTPTPPLPPSPPAAPSRQTKAIKKKEKSGRRTKDVSAKKDGTKSKKRPAPAVNEPARTKRKKNKLTIKVENMLAEDVPLNIPTPVVTPAPTPAPIPGTPTPVRQTPTLTPTPTAGSIKQPKGKKKKKSGNQFAIVTETVTATDEKLWLCPSCGGPDDGDVMVECDTCKEWYHLNCTNLDKPPEDDENWECEICAQKVKQALAASKQRPQTPAETVVTKTKTPDPAINTTPPPAVQVPAAAAGGSQDDCCPECNLPDDGTMMIQCDDPHCAKWFHGKCVNLLEEPKDDESWFCKVCVEKQQSAFKRRRRAK